MWNGIKTYSDQGGKIKDQSFGSMKGCRCAISCLVNDNLKKEMVNILHENVGIDKASEYVAVEYLRLTVNQMFFIIEGFDNYFYKNKNKYILLGRRLRYRAQKLPTWVGSTD